MELWITSERAKLRFDQQRPLDTVPHKHRHSKQCARLDEVLALFGCRSEIAPTDIERFGRRAGELIARHATPIRSSPPHKRRTSTRISKAKHH